MQGIKIDVLLEIEVVLIVLLIEAKELPATVRSNSFSTVRRRCEETGISRGTGKHKAQIVPELFRRRSDGAYMSDVRQTVDG